MRIEHHLLALAHVGPGKHHPAVAKPDMGDLHGDRDASDHHELVTPVELVGFTRIVGERNIGLRRYRPSGLRPGPGIAADGVIAVFVTNSPEFLEDADQGEPLALRLVRIALQKLIQLMLPRADAWHRLMVPLIGEVGLVRPQDLPHCSARPRTSGGARLTP